MTYPPGDNPEPSLPRLTTHPELTREQSEHLNRALVAPGRREGVRPGFGEHLGGAGQGCLYLGLLAMVVLALSWNILLGLLVAAPILTAVGKAVLDRRQEPDPVDEPDQGTRVYEGRYVSDGMLDAVGRGMLGRVQTAVDTVLGSALQERGLLLDEVRNRVVLADVEWSLSQSLLRQARSRHTLDTTPAVGERSERAAERARDVLDADAAEVDARIRVLEAYAERVREAERDLRDRELEAEFDAIANRAVEAKEARPHQDASLSALVRAQELALEVAALAPGPGAGDDERP